jgi:hypothetical protein
MPQNVALDLTAEDVTEPAWDELVRAMLGQQEAQHIAGQSRGDSDDYCDSCSGSGCGACHHIT